MQRAGSAHGPQPLRKQDRLGWKLRGAGAHQLFHQPMPNAGTLTLAALHHPKGRGEAGEASLAQTEPSRSSSSPQPPSSTGLAPSADIWVAQGRALLPFTPPKRGCGGGSVPRHKRGRPHPPPGPVPPSSQLSLRTSHRLPRRSPGDGLPPSSSLVALTKMLS